MTSLDTQRLRMTDLSVHPPAVWIGFTLVILVLLVLDLGVLNRHVARPHDTRGDPLVRDRWSRSRMLFCGFLWIREGSAHALEFFTGYLIELSLSVDNLFVFILVFQYFAVPAELQPKVLKWGIVGAIIMRAIMIGLGAAPARSASPGSSTSSAAILDHHRHPDVAQRRRGSDRAGKEPDREAGAEALSLHRGL